MTPQFHPGLVNGPFGDPAVYVDFLFARRALLFDLGEISRLPPRKILRLTNVFVSHTHMDHFIGFDHVVRICLGREKRLSLFGPPGFVERVEHRLAAYTWNLVESFPSDFTVEAGEFRADGHVHVAEFHCRRGFLREAEREFTAADGVLLDEESFRVRAVSLDHRIPSLAFTLEEKSHVNIMKNRLDELGLPVGPWLAELKRAVLREAPDSLPVRVWWKEGGGVAERHLPLGELKGSVLAIVPGQKITYVTDTLYSEANAAAIAVLAQGSDYLFIEAAFLDADAGRAAEKYHLTARQAGLLARRAGVARVLPFHISPKYTGEEERIELEVLAAFGGAGEA
jgi:ribonuclease Z